MKNVELVKTDLYLLLVEEEAEIKEGDYLYDESFGISKARYNTYEPKNKKTQWILLAYFPLTKEAKELDLPLLPNPFEDVNVLADTYVNNPYFKSNPNMLDQDRIKKEFLKMGFIEGYKAATKQFSLEDMKMCFEVGRNFQLTGEDNFTEYIQSLPTKQLPKQFMFYYKIECTKISCKGECGACGYMEKSLKTTTNSENKQELIGTYRY